MHLTHLSRIKSSTCGYLVLKISGPCIKCILCLYTMFCVYETHLISLSAIRFYNSINDLALVVHQISWQTTCRLRITYYERRRYSKLFHRIFIVLLSSIFCFVLYAFFCYTHEKLVALVPFSCLYFVTVQLNTNIEFSQLLFITFTAIWLWGCSDLKKIIESREDGMIVSVKLMVIRRWQAHILLSSPSKHHQGS